MIKLYQKEYKNIFLREKKFLLGCEGCYLKLILWSIKLVFKINPILHMRTWALNIVGLLSKNYFLFYVCGKRLFGYYKKVAS